VDKAKGEKVDLIEESGRLKKEFGDKIVLPDDLVAADEIDKPTKTKVFNINNETKLPDKWAFLDLGPKTIEKYVTIIKQAKTIFWDGPMGKYEDIRFRQGTLKIAEAVDNTTILGGGDTAALAENFGLIFRYSHVSVAGGATLEYLAGKPMPGIEVLQNK
jgi:phosphoglycerate kinase